MKTSTVNCILSTEYFRRGKTAVAQRVIRFLKTGSDLGSYAMVQEDLMQCMWGFFGAIDNFSDNLPDGDYKLIVKFYEGCYEYPGEAEVEYTLIERKPEDDK